MSLEKIINDAWEIKAQISPSSDQKLKDAINQIIADLDSGKVRAAEKVMVNGLLTNTLRKQ